MSVFFFFYNKRRLKIKRQAGKIKYESNLFLSSFMSSRLMVIIVFIYCSKVKKKIKNSLFSCQATVLLWPLAAHEDTEGFFLYLQYKVVGVIFRWVEKVMCFKK